MTAFTHLRDLDPCQPHEGTPSLSASLRRAMSASAAPGALSGALSVIHKTGVLRSREVIVDHLTSVGPPGPPELVLRDVTQGGHLGLFMSHLALREHWPPLLAAVLRHSTSQPAAGCRSPAIRSAIKQRGEARSSSRLRTLSRSAGPPPRPPTAPVRVRSRALAWAKAASPGELAHTPAAARTPAATLLRLRPVR